MDSASEAAPRARGVDVSVVIVNWNSREYLRKCLASLYGETTGLALEVVVIDSGSFDGCDAMLRDEYPGVKFVQSAENLGFARANNRAYRETTGEYILFLNPDTDLRGPAVNRLHAAFLAHPDGGAIGATLLNTDGSIQASCIRAIPTIANRILDCDLLRRLWPRSPMWGAAALANGSDAVQEIEAVSGACLMTRRSAFEAAGGFSEDYFMYTEDMDLCYKLRMAGFRNYYVPQAVVTHHGGSSSGQAPSRFSAVMMPEATWRFFRKSHGAAYAASYRIAMLVSAVMRVTLLEAARLVSRAQGGGARLDGSVRKWRAVLQWALRQDGIVEQYYGKPDAGRIGLAQK
jgi:hypothetical protein